jgi:thiol-disulfide isomerase/thioredoxin
MKKCCVLFLMSFLIVSNSFGTNIKQLRKNDNQFHFKIDGTINADTGTVSLRFYSEYIPNKARELVVRVEHNKFSISGYVSEPQAVFIDFGNQYRSADFIIEKGIQTISINTDSTRKVPVVLNNTMINEYPRYTAFFKQLDMKKSLFYQKNESLYKLNNYQLPAAIKQTLKKEDDNLYAEGNQLLLRYTEKNPSSKIAFWQLIGKMDWGYEPIFDSIYNAFSSELKNGYAGRILNMKLESGKQLSVGKLFPPIQCVNRSNEKFLSAIFLKSKFTLVDFWYSGCGPCRAQFDSLKDLYKQFSNKGFEIVGVSVDRDTDKKKWEDIIINDKLIWQQYWDMNGKNTKSLSINAFPTNFLIDNGGKIIAKNISMEKLEELLSESL